MNLECVRVLDLLLLLLSDSLIIQGGKQWKFWCLIFSKAAQAPPFSICSFDKQTLVMIPQHIWLIHLKRIQLFLAHPVQFNVPAFEFITRWNHSIIPFYTQRSLTGTIKQSEVISPTGPSEFMCLIPEMWFSLSLSLSLSQISGAVCAAVSLLFSGQIDTTLSLTACGREYVRTAWKKWLKLEFCSNYRTYCVLNM